MRAEKLAVVVAIFALLVGAVWVVDTDTQDVDATDFTVNNITYTTTGATTASVKTNTLSSLTSVTIPSTVQNDSTTYSVTAIDDNAFKNSVYVSAVIIGSNVKTIGANAFCGCEKLTSVTIPNSVTTIGASAFYDCENLASLVIPNTVTSIGEDAFHGCTGLNSIKFGNGAGPVNCGLVLYDVDGTTKITSDTSKIKGSYFEKKSTKLTKKIKVSFNMNGHGSSISDQFEWYNSLVTKPKDPKIQTGYKFIGWYKEAACTTEWNFSSDKVTSDTILYAKWEEIKVTNLTITNSPESLVFEKGKTLAITVNVEPSNAKNKVLEYKSSNDAVAKFGTTSETLNKLTGMAQGKVTITVKATDGSNVQTTCEVTILSGESHDVTVSDDGYGTGAPSKSKAKYGEEITLTSYPSAGYELFKWESSDVTITNNKFTMPDKAVTVKAVFGVAMNIIQADHGTITGDKVVQIGSSATYSFTPDKDYLLKEIKIDGEVVAQHVATYTLKDVSATHTITAVFEKHDGASSSKDDKGNVTEKYSQEIGDVKLNITETFNVDGTYSSTTSFKDDTLGIKTESESARDAEGKIAGSITCDVTVADQKKMTDIFKKAQASMASTSTFTGLTTKYMMVSTTTSEGAPVGFDLSFDASTYDGTYSIAFVGEAGMIEFDDKAFSTVKKEGNDVRIALQENKTEIMTEIQKWIVQDYQVYEVTASGNGHAVHDFDGKVILMLPLTLKEGETGDDAAIFFVDRFHAQNVGGEYEAGVITAELPHLSYYFAAGDYKESEKVLPSGYDVLTIVLLIVLIMIVAVFVIGFILWFDLDERQLYIDPKSLLFWRK